MPRVFIPLRFEPSHLFLFFTDREKKKDCSTTLGDLKAPFVGTLTSLGAWPQVGFALTCALVFLIPRRSF